MKQAKRVGDTRVLTFHPGERGVLMDLTVALVHIVSELLPDEGLDEFEAMLGQRVTSAQVAARDPALKRLFPSAYADASFDADFRRFTETDAAQAKIGAAATMWRDLNCDSDRVGIPAAHFEDWIKTLTAIRLVLSERNDPDLDDIFEWTGWVLESLLTV